MPVDGSLTGDWYSDDRSRSDHFQRMWRETSEENARLRAERDEAITGWDDCRREIARQDERLRRQEAVLAQIDALRVEVVEAEGEEMVAKIRAATLEADLAAARAALTELVWVTNILGVEICDYCGVPRSEPEGKRPCSCETLRAALGDRP